MNTFIKKPCISYYTPEELSSLGRRICNIANSFFPESSEGSLLVSFLEKKSKSLSNAIEMSRKSAFTSMLHEKDDFRIKLFSYIYNRVKAESNNPVSNNLRNSGEVILNLFFSNNMNLHKLSYGERSRKINHIIGKLNSKEYYGFCKTLGLLEWIKRLETAEKEFENIYSEKITKEHDEDRITIHEAVSDMINAYKNFEGFVSAFLSLGKKGMSDLAKDINEIVDDMEVIVKSRRTRNMNGKDDFISSKEDNSY